ncbi:MAG: hypothetical protein Q9227_009534 [Pyrenula ochraceoflavens]
MDLLDELETMATNAAEETFTKSQEAEIPPETVHRWQKLFGFTIAEARDHIIAHRGSVARTRVSDEHWAMVHQDKPGYDKESYEFEIDHLRSQSWRKPMYDPGAADTSKLLEDPASITYLVKLEGVLDTAQKIQAAASIPTLPSVADGLTDTGDGARFCMIDGAIKNRILDHLRTTGHQHFHPTFIRLSASKKDLSATSISPTLGLDATAPQNRLSSEHSSPGVLENQYPVWYFFYGNLAKPEILTKLLSLTEPPIYHPASVNGALIKRWAGKYNAVVDGPMGSVVEGSAYRVVSEEDESILRFHETGNYEVVRCNIGMGGGERIVRGLTFRYSGPLSAIS